MIKVKNLSKSYNNQLVLNNISIDIKKGEFISIVGPSGAGKTTFLNIIGTIDSYDKNKNTSLLFNKIDLTKLSDDELSIFRNKNISNDHASTADVMKHAVGWLEKNNISPKFVCCIYPTAAFLKPKDIIKAYKSNFKNYLCKINEFRQHNK